MKKRDLLFILMILGVTAGLFYLYFIGRHPQPTVQTIPEHQGFNTLTPRTKCLECHHPETGSIADLKKRITKTHPEKWQDEKFSCLNCHKLQAEAPKTANGS